MKKLILLLILFSPLGVLAQYSGYTNFCTAGAKNAIVSGLNSSNLLLSSYQQCTVSVYITKTTTLATIYSDSTGTTLNNPFTANVNTGQFLFYGATGITVDITMSGGYPSPGISPPLTLTGVTLGGGGGGGGGCTPSIPGYLLLSTSGGCANSLADYGITESGTFTFNAPSAVISQSTTEPALVVEGPPGSYATPSFVQIASSFGGQNTVFSSNLTNGNSILVACAFVSNSGTPAIADTQSNSFTLIATPEFTGSGYNQMNVWLAPYVVGGADTVSVTNVAIGNCNAAEYTNIDNTSPLDVITSSAAASSSANPYTAGPISTLRSTDLIVAFFNATAPPEIGTTQGYISRVGLSAYGPSWADKVVTSTGTYSAIWTGFPTTPYAYTQVLLALKATSSHGGSSQHLQDWLTSEGNEYVDAAGGATFANLYDTALTPGTSTICPNGVGGALTQIGCNGGIGGSGTATYIPLWNGTITLGNSHLIDNGTIVNSTIPFSVTGTGPATMQLGDATTPTPNFLTITVPNTVTAYSVSLPGSAPTGSSNFLSCSSSTTSVCTWSAGGSGLNQLTGDVTAGPGTGSQVATLATVNSNVGTFTNSTITVNAKGLITAASTGSGGGVSGLFNTTLVVPTTSGTGFSTAYNQQSSFAISNTATGIAMQDTTASTNLEGILGTYPGVAFTRTIFVSAPPVAEDYVAAGFVVAASTTGAALTCQVEANVEAATHSGIIADVEYFTNPSTYSSTYGTELLIPGANGYWLRWKDTGTSITCSYSMDGNYFWPLYGPISKTSTPLSSYNLFGLFIKPQTNPTAHTFMSYTNTNP